MRKRKASIIIAAALACVLIVAAIAVCFVFPNKYAAETDEAADEFGLSRALVRSVVWAESKFDRRAVSDKGAQGLMQLMPDTFRECAAALFINGADPFEPSHNLRCGCYYLSVLIDRFDGDETAALMAYNAGENNARLFLNGKQLFPETEKYLSDVAAAKRFYGFVFRD